MIPYITDFVILVFALLAFSSGQRRGLMRTIAKPLSFVISIFIAIYYFQTTQNLLVSIAIGILGPFLITIILSLFLNVWNATIDRSNPANPLSRTLGGILNLAWSLCILSLCVLFIAMLPENLPGITRVQQNVKGSIAYGFLEGVIKQSSPSFKNMQEAVTKLSNKEFQNPAPSRKVEVLRNEQKVKKVLEDKETSQQIENKDYSKLLSNPLIQDLIKDTDIMEKLKGLNLGGNGEGEVIEENSPEPKTYEY